MSKPIVAIVGRANIGKSALFNRITGKKISIVEDVKGVTRDRIYSDAEWLDYEFTIIDTGGLEPFEDGNFQHHIKQQVEIAIDVADVIIFLTSITDGITDIDEEIAKILRKSKKPVVLACNKADHPKMLLDIYDFYSLGFDEPIAVSAIHGVGTGDLLDEVTKYFKMAEADEENPDTIKIAVVGKPNAGKSSLINKILNEERSIVTDIPGTTRDSIDTLYEKDGQQYVLIDTAGIRKKNKVKENIEYYSVVRAYASIERSDVCLVLIDASEGASEQLSKIAGFVHNSYRACIIVVNKWDISDMTKPEFEKEVRRELGFMLYAPIMFISAKTGYNIEKLFNKIISVHSEYLVRVTTGVLNDVLNMALAKVQPPSYKGKKLKIYYGTQIGVKPPTFVIFVNSKELLHFSYERYLENQLREAFGLNSIPIKIKYRERENTN